MGIMSARVEDVPVSMVAEESARLGGVVDIEATEANVRFLREICSAVVDSSRKCEFWGKLPDGREWRVRCHKGK